MSNILKELLKEKILILDGAMGSLIQQEGLQEEDYRGSLYRQHPVLLKGNNDVLCLTQANIIENIHLQYLLAGADIIETNTFNATRISQSEYGLAEHVPEINAAAVRVAQAAIKRYREQTQSKRTIFIAGALGPTSKTASLASDVKNPMSRSISFEDLYINYLEQIKVFAETGADLILAETSFDTLNLKAAIFAYHEYFSDKENRLPLMLSLTITDLSGRTLSGQTIEAAWWSIRHAKATSVGINCALGAADMRPYLENLARLADTAISCYPNAGLPNPLSPTGYDETPESMAKILGSFAEDGLINIVGGCCGTTPAHIAAIKEAVEKFPPRQLPEHQGGLTLSGLEAFWHKGKGAPFIMVGERTNVTGSPKFADAMRRDSYEDALKIALQQVESGANVLDVNFDDGLLDSKVCMRNFLHLIGSEPAIAKVPVMLDSSNWEVLEVGLRCLQGKGVVNSISLKDGEDEFLRRAKRIQRYGAATIVMAFDEQGQAATKEDKVRILRRAYQLLTEKLGFNPCDIIFDPNVLTIGTGMEEHNRYALDFIEATEELKKICPGALVSGGISNLSFAFRGMNTVREAMHAVFLYHAIKAGLDMGIVNAGMLEVYDDIEPRLKTLVEDLVMHRRSGASEDLLQYATAMGRDTKAKKVKTDVWRQLPLNERVTHALVHGVTEYIEEDTLALLKEIGQALNVIEGPLMAGMSVVGDLFGKGKMFLPQVVKSARVMKLAVEQLIPYMKQDKATAKTRGTFVIATVKGDVHDIGKNIVSVVLSCNHFRVIDLGVMVPAEKILSVAEEENADFIGLSGLITPSLDEMIYFAQDLERKGKVIPLLIGGATTSKMHTAVKIAPHYQGGVIHVGDASQVAQVLSELLSESDRHGYRKKIAQEQAQLRDLHQSRQSELKLISLEEARSHKSALSVMDDYPEEKDVVGIRYYISIPLTEIVPYIDWSPFFWVWGLSGFYPKIFKHALWGQEAQKLFSAAQTMLEDWDKNNIAELSGALGIWRACSRGDDVLLLGEELGSKRTERARFHFLRQQRINDEGTALCLSDFVAPEISGRKDYMGLFAAKAGGRILDLPSYYEKKHDDYSAILVKSLADRLAEAMSEYLHKKSREIMGFGKSENLPIERLIKEEYRGIRPAPGYPACPDHTEKATIWQLLKAEEKLGISLTESYAMNPASAVSGFYFFHPDARYFRLGKIDHEQVKDYASRKGLPEKEVERWLAAHIADS